MDRVTPAITMEDVSAAYREAPVLEDLSLTVAAGDLVGVIGPNGAGKTSLIRVITGLIRPRRGRVRLFGEDVARMPAARRAALVGVVSQEMDLPVAFTVEEYVTIGRTAALGRWTRPGADDRRIVERAMAYTDVVDMRRQPVTELSGGERQRVVVARVLAQQPRIILMDEATAHLDMNHCLEVMQIVDRLNREEGVTVLLVTHDLNLSAEFCRRLILLDRGRVVRSGPPADVLNEETLRGIYRCEVRVRRHPGSGALLVSPSARLASGRSGRGVRVHVIAGGGCAEECLRTLSLCEYTVSAGVLNRADSDADVAAALGIPVVLETPFSRIGPAAVAAARRVAASADAIVVCGVPFGPGNLVNLDLAAEAVAVRKPVLIQDGIEERDYTPGRQAVERVRSMLGGGARTWRTVTDLLAALPSAPGAGERR